MFRLLLANRPVGITGTRLLNLRRVLRGRVQEPVEGRVLLKVVLWAFHGLFGDLALNSCIQCCQPSFARKS